MVSQTLEDLLQLTKVATYWVRRGGVIPPVYNGLRVLFFIAPLPLCVKILRLYVKN